MNLYWASNVHLITTRSDILTPLMAQLPDDLAELVLNKKRFLIQLKKYLTEKPFYSLEEYLNA